MAEITNPTAVRFCNERVRPVANRMAQLYNFARAVRDEWVANDLGSVITQEGGTIVDGSATDGRHQITGANVHALAGLLVGFIDSMEANNNAQLNTILGIATRPAVGVGVEDR